MSFATVDEGRYQAHVPALEILFDVDRLHRERHELHGELTVTTGIAGARVVDGSILSRSAFNFSSTRARQDRAKFLLERARTGKDVDWTTLIEDLCHRVLTAENTGKPAVLLHEVPRPAPEAFHVVEGWSLPKYHPAMVFGDGGGCKSLIALYCAGRLAQAGVRVGYFDWELSAGEHRGRLEGLFGNAMPMIHYVRCDRPMVYAVDHLKRIRQELGLEYAVFDSVAPACDGPPEAAEVAAGYFRAVRQLGDGFGSVHVAHVAKAEGADLKPFGSAFWHNLARSTWNFKPGEDETTGRTVALYHRKSNLSRLSPPLGFDVRFTDDEITITRTDLAQVEEFAPSLPLWQRLRAEVLRGPCKVHQLAERLNAKAETVERTLRRHNQIFTKVSLADNAVAWGIRTDAAA